MNKSLQLKQMIWLSGMRQYEVASRARIDPTRFSKIVNGLSPPTEEEKDRIACLFKTKPGEIFKKGTEANE